MTLAVSSTGHAAMECAMVNAVEPGDSVLAAVNGIWGERAADMAERIGRTLCSSMTWMMSYVFRNHNHFWLLIFFSLISCLSVILTAHENVLFICRSTIHL